MLRHVDTKIIQFFRQIFVVHEKVFTHQYLTALEQTPDSDIVTADQSILVKLLKSVFVVIFKITVWILLVV